MTDNNEVMEILSAAKKLAQRYRVLTDGPSGRLKTRPREASHEPAR
jgi:hypothetical protein